MEDNILLVFPYGKNQFCSIHGVLCCLFDVQWFVNDEVFRYEMFLVLLFVLRLNSSSHLISRRNSSSNRIVIDQVSSSSSFFLVKLTLHTNGFSRVFQQINEEISRLGIYRNEIWFRREISTLNSHFVFPHRWMTMDHFIFANQAKFVNYDRECDHLSWPFL